MVDIPGRIHPLHTEADLEPLLARIGDSRFVLLGEATHGTAEFYRWRATITRRLIERYEFTTIAVEGDWPDCYAVHRFVRGFPEAASDARTSVSSSRSVREVCSRSAIT